MTEELITWWRARTLREQRLLLIMFALMAVVLAWLVVVRPLGDALSDARERHGRAVAALAQAKAEADAIARLEQDAPAALAAPVEAVVGQSATEAGFPVTRAVRSDGNQAILTLASVRPRAFFAWLGQMQARGFVVERLTATANSDQTLAVELAIRARGR